MTFCHGGFRTLRALRSGAPIPRSCKSGSKAQAGAHRVVVGSKSSGQSGRSRIPEVRVQVGPRPGSICRSPPNAMYIEHDSGRLIPPFARTSWDYTPAGPNSPISQGLRLPKVTLAHFALVAPSSSVLDRRARR